MAIESIPEISNYSGLDKDCVEPKKLLGTSSEEEKPEQCNESLVL